MVGLELKISLVLDPAISCMVWYILSRLSKVLQYAIGLLLISDFLMQNIGMNLNTKHSSLLLF